MWIPMKPKFYKDEGVWITIKETLLPSYILAQCPDPWDLRHRIQDYQSTMGIHMVGRRPQEGEFDVIGEVTPEELDYIHILCGDTSFGVKEGDTVTITSGPLVRLCGYIRKIDRHHRYALIDLPFMGRIIEVKAALEVVSAGPGAAEGPIANILVKTS